MNKKLLIITGAAVTSVGIYSASTFAANVANSTATANVIAPMAILEVAALDFGDISEDGTGGAVEVLVSDGTRNPTGGASISASDAGNRGSYTVTGAGNRTYSIDIPDTTLTGLGTAMPVTFTHDAGATPTLSTGADAFLVGGTITMNAPQTPDSYTGTYSVTVNYN